jgi:hypothetical protein
MTAEHLAANDLVVGLSLAGAYAQLGLGLWLLVGTWLGSAPGTAPLVVALAGSVLRVGRTALLPRSWRGRTLDALLGLGALVWLGWLTGALR